MSNKIKKFFLKQVISTKLLLPWFEIWEMNFSYRWYIVSFGYSYTHIIYLKYVPLDRYKETETLSLTEYLESHITLILKSFQ